MIPLICLILMLPRATSLGAINSPNHSFKPTLFFGAVHTWYGFIQGKGVKSLAGLHAFCWLWRPWIRRRFWLLREGEFCLTLRSSGRPNRYAPWLASSLRLQVPLFCNVSFAGFKGSAQLGFCQGIARAIHWHWFVVPYPSQARHKGSATLVVCQSLG